MFCDEMPNMSYPSAVFLYLDLYEFVRISISTPRQGSDCLFSFSLAETLGSLIYISVESFLPVYFSVCVQDIRILNLKLWGLKFIY